MTFAPRPQEGPSLKFFLDLTRPMPVFTGLIFTDQVGKIAKIIQKIVGKTPVESSSAKTKWNVNAVPFTPAVKVQSKAGSKANIRLEFKSYPSEGKVILVFNLFYPQPRELEEIYKEVRAAVYARPKVAAARSFSPLFSPSTW